MSLFSQDPVTLDVNIVTFSLLDSERLWTEEEENEAVTAIVHILKDVFVHCEHSVADRVEKTMCFQSMNHVK